MKSISIIIGTCLLLILNTTLTAQRQRPLIKKSAGALVNRQEPTSPNAATSCIVDTVLLTSQAAIDNFSTNYPACTDPKYLIIDGTNASPAITSLAGLAGVTQVNNKLVISHTSVTSLAALSNLTFIGDALQLDHNPLITNIGLNNLTQLGSIIFIDLPLLTNITGLSNHITGTGIIDIDSTALTGLAGLENIEDINGDLHLAHSPFINVNNLTHLSTIEGAIFIDDLPSITSVVVNGLTNVQNILFINAPQLNNISALSYHLINKNIDNFWAINTALSSMSGLDSLTGINNFTIWSNPNLTSLHGFEQLTGNVQYDISIYDNSVLADISALSHITSMSEGTLEIATNNSLSGLTGLGNINTIGGGLWITDDPSLTSLGDLNNNLVIHNNNSSAVVITGNDVLALCSFGPICNYLAGGGNAIVHDNDPGCDNIAEIQAACDTSTSSCTGGVLKTWNGSVSSSWEDATNWTPTGIPGVCDSVLITKLPNYPIAGTHITISGLRMTRGSHLDMSGFDFTDNGNIILDSAGIGNGVEFNIHAPVDPHIDSCLFFAHHLVIANFTGGLQYSNSYILGDVNISDGADRSAPANIANNYFNGNLIVTANTTDAAAVMNISSLQSDVITGDETLNINSPTHVNVGGSNFQNLTGDLIVNSNFEGYASLRSVEFDNFPRTSYITQTGTAPVHIKVGRVSGGNLLVPDHDVYIDSLFHFASGRVRTASDKLLIFGVNTNTFNNVNGTSFAWGPVKKIGSNGFYFPVGDSIYNGGCRMSAPSQVTDAFTAEYFHRELSLSGYDTSQHVSSIARILSKEYWTVNRNNGNSNVQLGFTYDTARSGPIPSTYDLRVAGWNGSQWQNLGNGGITGDAVSGTILSGGPVSSFGIFALALAPHRIPVITIANADSVACAASDINIHFTLDTLMFSNNVFTAQLSDSSGSFATPFQFGSISSNHSDSIFGFIPSSFPGGNHYKIRIVGNAPADTSIAKTIVLKPFPSPGIVVHGPAIACFDGSIYKYWVTPAQPGIIYNWNINIGDTITSNFDTAYVRFSYLGYHSVSVVNANICRTGTLAYEPVFVSDPAPTASPVLNNSGRWLYSSAPAANQHVTGFNWYKDNVLVNGAAGNSYYASAAGSYKVRYYNACNEGPASNVISFAAASIPQTINFPAIPNKTYGDAPFVPAATATSGLPVSFSIVSGPATINSQTNLLTITGTGTVTVQANQIGDNIYDTAVTVTRSFAVNKAIQTISFPSISEQDINNGTVNLLATSSSGLPIGYSIVSGLATVSGNFITLTGVGTVTVRASQSGDTNYLPASNVNQNFCTRVTNLNPVSGYTNLCPGTATYTVNNIPGASYLWRIAGGNILPSTTYSANVTWATPGNYALIVSASGNCGAASNNDTLLVHVINSIQPDSVQNMLPASGAINQQLPLTLSWIPAHPANFYTFDLYLWRANQTQPTTPYAAGLTAVDYTLPVSSGLLSNQAYKWMVVAHNGSCTQINTGPIQQFTLIPLPDLKVQNVQAPLTAFSGQSISINWTVRNDGPGNTTTNQSWTDGVFLSFDSIPNFTIPPGTNAAQWNIFEGRPLLIGTRSNVSALDSGQQYSNALNFTIPVNYSQPLYVYVIANYPASVNAPQQTTFANDTARAPLPIAVTLSPTPDLRVDTVFTPNTTFSGSTINLTYKVKNHGVLTPPASGWVDRIYISQSSFFDINTAIPIKVPKANGTYYANAVDAGALNSGQLLADSSYTRSMDVVVPNFIFGTYFIYVFTDADHSVYEGSLENNNTNRNQVQVFLTPTPHLTVSSLTLPVTTASTTQPIGVNWNIQNTGFNDNIEKNQGHYVVYRSVVCNYIPPYLTSTIFPGLLIGDSLGFGSSSWIDRVYLSTDSTGLNVNTAVLVNQTSHTDPHTVTSIDSSNCKPLGADLSGLNINTATVIKPSGNYPESGNFIIPSNLPAGNYYVYVLTNATHAVYEYPGLPETRRNVLPIAVQRPDATVSSVTVPATASGGQPITINYSVLNIGPGTVFNQFRKDNIYVSASPVFDGSAQLINTLIYSENLPVGTAVTHSTTYTFPAATSGNRYLYVYTNYDSLFREVNYSNNISSAAAGVISITPGVASDLVVSSIQLADTIYAVASTNFKYTVHNNGPGTTAGAAWTDSLFISCSPTFNPATSYYVTKRDHSEIVTAGNNYSDSFNINFGFGFDYNNCFPQTIFNTPYFFVKTNANNGLYEGSNGSNNVNGTGSKVLVNTLVDHIVTSVTGADTTLAGHPYVISWAVKNIGYNPGNYAYYGSVWYDGLYFSPDSVLNANAVSASYNSEGTVLNNNQTYVDSKNTTTPNLPTGDYYVSVFTNAGNNIYAEKILSNNSNLIRNASGAAKKIRVIQPSLPDLTDSILSAASTVATGQPFVLTHRVSNRGAGATYPANWSDAVWLSTDFIPGNGSDILLSATNHAGVLQPNQSFDDTILIPVALNAAPGNYVLISQVNQAGNVFESNTNNNLAFSYITVYRPAPADLVVESIMKPDTVLLGYTLDTAKWVIRNIAANTAVGYTSDGIYLSQGNVLDSTAVLLGIKGKQINMGPLARDTITLQPLVNNVPEGNYNVIVKTDLLNNIVESDKANNTGIALTPLYVKVKELPLNVLTPNTLFNVNRIYKLIIPDSLNAATILVTLKSGDSLNMKNQVFIGKGYIPSAAHFDYTYSTPNYGNQDIVMTSITAGVYYITIRNVSQVPVIQNITLKAVKLPFAILGVQSGSGGNIGNVTIKISGSLFTNNMTAKLSKPGTVIDAAAVYFSNSTIVYATFDLQGKPLGIYDVTLTKPDTSMAVLVNGFSVVPANNGGLNNGGGTNTGAGNGNAPGCDPGAAGGINSQLVIEMVAPDKVFAGWPFVMQVNYSNPTNMDIPAQVRILYSQMDIKMALTPESVANGTTALYLELTEQNGPPGIIRAGASGTITVYAKAPTTIPGHTIVFFKLQ